LRRGYVKLLLVCVQAGALLHVAWAQTYKVGAESPSPPPQTDPNKNSTQKELGWGSNIQNARLARAAEAALKNGDYPAALNYAQRASEAAPSDAQLWFLLGYTARLARKPQLSLDAYNHGLKLDPTSLDGLSGLAQTYSLMGRRDEAVRLLTQVLASAPKRAGDAELLGELLLQSGDYEHALSILSSAEAMGPSARLEVLMALSCQRLQRYDQASRYLEMAKKRAPNNPDVERSLAGFYRETGNYKAAISALKTIHNPNPQIMAELAYTYQLNGQPDESATLYAKAADSAPGDDGLQLSAAEAQININAADNADPFLKRAASLDPESYRLHAIRGEIDRLREQNEDAVREYTEALSRLPQAPVEGPLYGIQLHLNLLELCKGLNNDSAAKQQLEIAQSQIAALDEHGANRPAFLRLRAQIKMNAGNLNGAEQDIQEALNLNPKDPSNLQVSGDLLAKLGHPEEAIAVYKKILVVDPVNRSALVSLGFVSRESGHTQDAEKYFHRLAEAYPKLYIPYLALGDLYASQKEFAKSQNSYRRAYELAPKNPLIIAGGMNAAIEDKHFSLAAEWLARATPEMQHQPFILREKERYLSWTGKYQESADVGQEAIQKLPRDRDVVVYLGYDWLHLERYEDLLKLTAQYEPLLPKEPDLPLLAGYVHKHAGALEDAEGDFSRAVDRDPNVATAYVNRGYVYNDLHQASSAASDFEAALRLEPKNGEAHLGLAYASLSLHHPRVALKQVQVAQEEMGDSMPIHLIRATAYGDEGALTKAAVEYRFAIKFSPNDGSLHLALANALYGLFHYQEAIAELQIAEKLTPSDSAIYARLALCYAKLHDRANTMANVELAEQKAQAEPGAMSTTLVSTGEALSALGDRSAAMERFEKALVAPDADRLAVRLAVARQMAASGESDEARRQIALGFMEVRTNQATPPTGSQWVEAADVFLSLHDFQLAEQYFQHAIAAGAAESSARVGLANAYLAQGDTSRAEAQISSVPVSADSDPSYEYLLARANVYRQQHQSVQSLTAFAQAAEAAGQDETAEQELLRAAGDEGLRINDRLSVLSDFSVAPIFEDTTIYPLDAKLDVPNPIPGRQGLLPSPRSSLETQWTGAYHLHFADLPGAGGFFQIRNARGEISLPSADAIINRDTTDYTFNFGLNPTVHLGNNALTFSTGIQGTIRRDSEDPYDMNQNLLRQFVYLSTSSFFDMVSVSGYAIREAGPFTENNQHSRDLAGEVDFRVGRPWGKTAFVTGWGARDDQYRPIVREFYFTSIYAGIEHIFTPKLSIRAVAENLRAWRVEGMQYAISQAIRPAASFQYSPTRNWSIQATAAYSRNMGFHAYDAVLSGFAVSYAVPIHRTFTDEGNRISIRYPIRFSAGMQQEDFFNFPASGSQQLRPYVNITIF